VNIRLEKMGLDPEKLRELLASQQQDGPESAAEPEAASSGDGSHPTSASEQLQFDLKPEELIAYLDEFVIRQDSAKAILATKICTHFNRLKLPLENEEDLIGNIKNNILMIGPTGVGKTYIIKLIARRLGVPFVKADATKFSETGYVGGDVEDLVRELVAEADGDMELAQHGIIYIDEIDKIASSRDTTGPDVSRSGVQRNLLKLMEETDVDLKAPNDISSQMESVIQLQKTGKMERKKINTRNILFVVSGAFSGLDDIIARRLKRGSMGFSLLPLPADTDHNTQEQTDIANLSAQVRAEDLIEYGFDSEFIGRLPVVAVLDELSQDDLFLILSNPKSSVILSKKRDFKSYGIDLTFTENSLALLAERAFGEHTGARGLVSAIEKALLSFECKLPSSDIDSLTVDDGLVREPEKQLRQLLIDQSLTGFVDSFQEEHGIKLMFDDSAKNEAKDMAAARGELPVETCREALRDYGHGLKLLELQEFVITADVLRDPQAALNRLIKRRFGDATP
jgi:ATP-dependent Clp protease ATP-binding subunit ClpX